LVLQEIFEMSFRRAFAVCSALALTIAAPSAAQDTKDAAKPAQPQQRKLTNDERREYIALNDLVDAVAAGKQPAPADLTLKFNHHLLKSNNNVYIPYIVEIGGGTFSSFPITMYVRAVAKGAAAAPPAPAAPKAGEAPKTDAMPEWPFADAYFLEEKNLTTVGATPAIARALQLAPGEYTLYIAMRDRPSKDKKVVAKTALLTQPLTVPDMNKELTTSSIILAKALDPAPEQLTGQQQLEQPFTISGYRITPAFAPTIPQSEELLFLFFIYNEGVAASGKPDLEVDYHFFRAAEDKPFTRLATTAFNATTLPGQFDLKVGHQVFVGQGIPLKSAQMTFAPGDYRLEIKITDKTNSQTITRNVPFTVS
jgi:hypothetical protein